MRRPEEAAANDSVILAVALIVALATAVIGALAWAAWRFGETLAIWLDE